MLRKGDEPIPGYRLEQFLGRGQFGEVWRTTAPGGTSAALKFINLTGMHGIKEFRGIQRVKEIRHAHLMPITALWMLDAEGAILSDRVVESYNPDGQLARDTLGVTAGETLSGVQRPEWLVVAMLLGHKNLLDRLAEHQAANRPGIPVEELLRYMEEAAKGIDFLNSRQHDLGEGRVSIQHCDIKPANIMLIGDSVLVCDFGLARVLADTAATATGMVGSPAYMAPECVNRRPSHASDQYSLAITYVELRTGRLPFAEESYLAILEAHRHGVLDLSGLPPAERDVIRKATALRPEDRYPSSVAMVQALKRAVEADGAPSISPARRFPLGKPALVVLGAAAAAGITFWGLSHWPESRDVRPRAVDAEPEVSCPLAFDPPSARVRVNEAPFPLDAQGTGVLKLRGSGPIRLQVQATDDYAPLDRTYTADQLRKQELPIRLARSAQFYERIALEGLKAGDWRAAIDNYKEAIRQNTSFATPKPRKLAYHTAALRDLAVDPQGRWLVSAGDAGLACAWPLGAEGPGEQRLILNGHKDVIEAVSFCPQGGPWVVTASWDRTAIVWDLRGSRAAEPWRVLEGHAGDVVAAQFSPDGRWIATASADGVLRLWRWDPASGKKGEDPPLLLKGHSDQIVRMAMAPDGRWLVSIDAERKVFRWDLGSADPASSKAELPPLAHSVKACLITPDSRWLVTGGDDGRVLFASLGNASSGAELAPLAAGGDQIESLAIDGKGRRLLAGGTDGDIAVWNLSAEGRWSAGPKLEGHLLQAVAVSITPDGRWALSGGWDKAVYLWDLESSKPSATRLLLPGHGDRVNAAVLSLDGRWAATGDEKGILLLWDLPRCQLIHRAKAELPPVRAET